MECSRLYETDCFYIRKIPWIDNHRNLWLIHWSGKLWLSWTIIKQREQRDQCHLPFLIWPCIPICMHLTKEFRNFPFSKFQSDVRIVGFSLLSELIFPSKRWRSRTWIVFTTGNKAYAYFVFHHLLLRISRTSLLRQCTFCPLHF